MPKSIKEIQKRGRGRPATGRDPAVTSRLPLELIASLDAWAARNECSRAEAIRRLVEAGLATGAGSHQPHTKKSADEAAEMAERQIDRMSDQSATSEERQSRKRKLLKGPSEFRDMRKKPSKR